MKKLAGPLISGESSPLALSSWPAPRVHLLVLLILLPLALKGPPTPPAPAPPRQGAPSGCWASGSGFSAWRPGGTWLRDQGNADPAPRGAPDTQS